MADAFFITGDKAARYRVAYTTTSSSFLMSVMPLKWFLKKSSQLILKDENNIMSESGYM